MIGVFEYCVVCFYVFIFGVLYDSIDTTNADGNLEWVRPTTGDASMRCVWMGVLSGWGHSR